MSASQAQRREKCFPAALGKLRFDAVEERLQLRPQGAEDFVEKLQSRKVDCCLLCVVVVVVVKIAFFRIFVHILVLTFYVHTRVFSHIGLYCFAVAPNDGTTTGTRLGVHVRCSKYITMYIKLHI
jgi:hypothetical protein